MIEMGKFSVTYFFRARHVEIVDAESKEEMIKKVDRDIESEGFEIDADEILDINYDIQEMHPVTRDEKEIWTSNVLNSDVRGHQSALLESPLFATAKAVAGEVKDPCPNCGSQLDDGPGGGVKCPKPGCGYWSCY